MKETTAIKFRDASAVIENALAGAVNPGICFSGGKKSVLLLYMIRKQRPKIKVFFVDSGDEFPEILAFIQKMQKLWGLNLVYEKLAGHDNDLIDNRYNQAEYRCLQDIARRAHIDCLFLGFTSSTDRVTYKNFDRNVIVAPLDTWTDDDVLECIRSSGLPLCSLYSKGYRKVDRMSSSKAESPDAKNDSLDEKIIREKLKKLGYL